MLVRPSGTEPLVRVMVEAPTEDEADAVCGRLVAWSGALGELDSAVATADRASWSRAVARWIPAGPPTRLREARVRPMCGIVGYVGKRPVQDLLLAGLKKLEYRGYDSAGISVIADGQIESVRAVGNLERAAQAVDARAPTATAAWPRPRTAPPPASGTRAGPRTGA